MHDDIAKLIRMPWLSSTNRSIFRQTIRPTPGNYNFVAVTYLKFVCDFCLIMILGALGLCIKVTCKNGVKFSIYYFNEIRIELENSSFSKEIIKI